MTEIQAVSKGRIEAKAGGPWAMRIVEWADRGNGLPWVVRADMGGKLRGDVSHSDVEMPQSPAAVSWRLVLIDASGFETVLRDFEFRESTLSRMQKDWYAGLDNVFRWRLAVDMAAAGESRVVGLHWQSTVWPDVVNEPMSMQTLYTEMGNVNGGQSGVVRSAVLTELGNGHRWAVDVLIAQPGGNLPPYWDWLGAVPGDEAFVSSEGGVLTVHMPGAAP